MSTATTGEPTTRGADEGGRQRLARPDPPLADRERRAGADGRRGQPAGNDRRTPRSSRRRSSAPTTTTRTSRSSRARGSMPEEIYDRIAVKDVQLARRRAGRRSPRHARARRLRLARGRARPRARHRADDRRRADVLEGARPSQRDDQDPGHARGRPRDRAGDLRGHQRQRHAAVRGRGVRAGRRGVPARAGAPPARRGCRSTSIRSRHSSSPASTPTSTRSSRRSGAPISQGRAALANARAAYRRFQEIFSGPRWEALHHAGAAVQRPLWASTGTKNPSYSDTKYVDGLVGPHTVNTMPLATLQAFADHGHGHRPDGRARPHRGPRSARQGRDRHEAGHRRAARRRRQAVRGRDEPSARGDRAGSARR